MADTNETICDAIVEMRDLAEHRDWNNHTRQSNRERVSDLADRFDRARMKMEIEIANLRKENAKLREALDELVANIEMRSSTFGLNVMVDTKTYLDAKAALATPQHHEAASLQDAPAN